MILIENYKRAIYLYFHRTWQPQCSVSDHLSSAAMMTLCTFWRANAFFPLIVIAPDVLRKWGSINSLLFCLFVFISANVYLGGWILQLGKNLLVKNTPPHTAKCILGGVFFTISMEVNSEQLFTEVEVNRPGYILGFSPTLRWIIASA